MNSTSRLLTALFAALPAVLLVAGCASQPPSHEAHIANFERAIYPRLVIRGETVETGTIEERMREFNVPGVSVAVLVLRTAGLMCREIRYFIANMELNQKPR